MKNLYLFLVLVTAFISIDSSAQTEFIKGKWLINEDLSENTDDKVELALEASGVKPSKGFFNRDEEYYRGGPAEQEMYDYISYEKTLDISITESEYLFQYGAFERLVYLDDRGNRVSLTGLNEVTDFSFAHWENEHLMIEARPRDGGFTDEIYTLSQDKQQLTAQLYIQPKGFRAPIELVRIYDRLESEI